MGYRVSKRLATRDYRKPGRYFVTICTHQRAHYFGKIRSGNMMTSPIGEIASQHWYEIPLHAAQVVLHEFVIMPNHLHGILEIIPSETAHYLPKTPLNALPGTPEYHSHISPKSGDLSSIIRTYKGAVTRTVHRLGHEFQWQKSYHDHVIRAGEEERIRQYILNNPKNWKEDGFYSSDVGGWEK